MLDWKSEKGISLIEILIVVIMLGIVSLAINEFVIKGVINSNIQNAKSTLTMENLTIFNLLEDDFKVATDVEVYRYNTTTGVTVDNLSSGVVNLSDDDVFQIVTAIDVNAGHIIKLVVSGQPIIYMLIKDNNKLALARFDNNNFASTKRILTYHIDDTIDNTVGNEVHFLDKFLIDISSKIDETNMNMVSYKIDYALYDDRIDEMKWTKTCVRYEL